MKIVRTLEELRSARASLDGRVGLVPTMGALHAGHASLIEQSVHDCEHTVVTIYVNPTQFNNSSDLENYPDTLDADLALAERLGATVVWLPAYQEIYPDDFRFHVDETEFSTQLCGSHRPGHFRGVLTVVMKLLNVVRPDAAYFGLKDHQQYQLVKDMCEAFFMPVEIVGCETVREEDGLALSSRNLRLAPDDRALAPQLHRLIRTRLPDAQVIKALTALGFRVDYVVSRNGRRYAAATLGQGAHEVRLIDNVPLPAVTRRDEPDTRGRASTTAQYAHG